MLSTHTHTDSQDGGEEGEEIREVLVGGDTENTHQGTGVGLRPGRMWNEINYRVPSEPCMYKHWYIHITNKSTQHQEIATTNILVCEVSAAYTVRTHTCV